MTKSVSKCRILVLMTTLLLTACGASSPLMSRPAQSDGQFVWGTLQAPELTPPGQGAGVWDSEAASPDNVMLAPMAKTYLGTSGARQRYGVEAAGSFRHYFDNDGSDYAIDLAKLMADVPRVATLYQDLILALRLAAEVKEPGRYQFSTRVAPSTSIARAESENWYLAVAGFSYWLSGEIDIDAAHQIGGSAQLNLWDRYDWDPGTIIPIATPLGTINIDQDRVGQFHRQGLAQEFDTWGVYILNF